VILRADLQWHTVASHVDLREVLQTLERSAAQLRNEVDGECEVGGIPWDTARDGQETSLGAVHHDRTAVAGHANVTREGFGVPSRGRRRIKIKTTAQAGQRETQQDDDTPLLLDGKGKRGGGGCGGGAERAWCLEMQS